MNFIKTHFHLTTTNAAGLLIILAGIISIFLARDPHFASTCITVGAGLVATGKVCNDFGWNNHRNRQERTIRIITLDEYHNLTLDQINDKNIEWRVI